MERGDISKNDNLYNGIFEFGIYPYEQTTWYVAEVLISDSQKLTTGPVRMVATNFSFSGLDYSKFKTIKG